MTNIQDFDQLFYSEFVKAGLLLGQPRTLTISDIQMKEFETDNGTKEAKGVILFRETDKKMRINKTNGYALKAMFGRKPAQWVGKRVTIAPTLARFGRDEVDAVRVVGSPDIEEDVSFILKLPKNTPKRVTLTKTATKKEGGDQ